MFTLTTLRYFTLVTAFAVILLSWGCGDDPIDNTRTTTSDEESSAAPFSAIYFPMSVGNRWVYQNSDGSQWSREVVQSEIIEHDSYYSFTYNPPIEGAQPDFIKSPTYVVDPAAIFLQTKKNDINDAIWQTVLLSKGDFSGWSRGQKFSKGVWTTRKRHDDILIYLFYSQIRVIEHSDFTLLHFPPDYPQRRIVIHMTITGNENRNPETYIHGFEANVRIWGNTSIEPVVTTSIGRFENCLKLENSAEATPVETLVYETGELRARNTDQENKSFLGHLEDEINSELTKLLPSLMQNLNLRTMWLAPGVGPVKIEIPNGIAELIDYEVKALASEGE